MEQSGHGNIANNINTLYCISKLSMIISPDGYVLSKVQNFLLLFQRLVITQKMKSERGNRKIIATKKR